MKAIVRLVLGLWVAGSLVACGASDDGGGVTDTGSADETSIGAETGADTEDDDDNLPYGTPQVEILQPADGEILLEGASVVLEATVSDANDELDTLSWSWESDLDGILAEGDAAEAEMEIVVDALSGGSHILTFSATDPGLNVGQDFVLLVMNRPPGDETVVTIDPATPTTSDSLTAVIVESAVDPDGKAVAYSYTWYNDDAATGISVETVSSALTERGQVWRVVATPTDGHVSGPPAEASVVIANAAPSVDGAQILPSAGDVTTTFTCQPTGFDDADSDGEGFQYAWRANGVELEGETAMTLDGALLTKGDELVCVVTPWDGTDAGTPVVSEPVPILDAPPAVEAVNIDPLEGDVTTTFTCSWDGLSDPDPGDEADIKHIWVVNEEDLPGTTSTSFEASGLTKGDTVQCRVVPFSGPVDGKEAASEVVTLGNAIPSAGSGLVTPSPATEATGVTCVPGELFDPDGDNVAWEIVWYVDGEVVEGQSDELLTGEHYDKGQEVWCEVIPFDGADHGVPVESKLTVTISNTPPMVASASVTPAEGSKSDTFTCVPEGAADADPADTVSFQFEWKINGEVVPGGIFETLVPTGLSGALTCCVTPTDGEDEGATVESSPAIVTNHAPTITHVVLGPEPATESTELLCQPQGWYDQDGDPEGYQYTWAVNGVPLQGYTAASLDGGFFDKNDLVVCFAAADDGGAVGPNLPSNTVTIGNSPPTLTGATIDPNIGSASQTFTCEGVGGSDLDLGDPLIVGYQWFAGGVAVDGADQQTFVPTAFGVPSDGTIACQATPFDGTDLGPPVMSDPAVLTNLPPGGDAAIVLPSVPTTVDDLSCQILGLEDPDGDDVTLEVVWVLNGTPLEGEDGDTLTHHVTEKGDKVQCIATPSDGVLTGDTLTSPEVTVVNSPPTQPEVTLGPALAAGGEALTCSATSTDADEDELFFTYQWARDGLIQPSYTAADLPAGVTDDCETWTCYVTVTDGEATPPPGNASLDIGGGGGGGLATFYDHHSFDPTSNPALKQTNQFFQVEIAATRIDIPANALPAQLTQVRLYAQAGTPYTVRIYANAGGIPGNQLGSQSFTGAGTLQTVQLSSPISLSAATTTIWIGLQGSFDFMTVYTDANGQATSNMIYGCDAFLLGECWGTWGWKIFAAFGPPFSGLGDLVISAGLGGGSGTACD